MIVGAGERLLSAELTQSSASLCEFCGPSALSAVNVCSEQFPPCSRLVARVHEYRFEDPLHGNDSDLWIMSA
jgi:hypothetical protein